MMNREEVPMMPLNEPRRTFSCNVPTGRGTCLEPGTGVLPWQINFSGLQGVTISGYFSDVPLNPLNFNQIGQIDA